VNYSQVLDLQNIHPAKISAYEVSGMVQRRHGATPAWCNAGMVQRRHGATPAWCNARIVIFHLTIVAD
jgi:hypothetical protein